MLYNGTKKTSGTITLNDDHGKYNILIFLLRANANTDVYEKMVWWKNGLGDSNVPYVKFNCCCGDTSGRPSYHCDFRVWGGSGKVIGIAAESYNDGNWTVGVIKVLGVRFVNL